MPSEVAPYKINEVDEAETINEVDQYQDEGYDGK